MQQDVFIAGFTIIRNAVLNDYPIVEAIRSILPVVDEMVVLVGDSEDDTLALIESIEDEKVKIHHSVWDPAQRQGGTVLAAETNKALALINPEATWAFYIQADEVVHEKYHPAIREAARRYAADSRVEGLLFGYTHFYGTYRYVGHSRKWYPYEVRIIRNDAAIQSYLDAQGFRKGQAKLRVKRIAAQVYHYGWVKSPRLMREKLRHTLRFWFDDAAIEAHLGTAEVFDYNDFDSIRHFEGTHPAVMQGRIAAAAWDLTLDVTRKKMSLKKRLLQWIEDTTGKRWFAFTNYREL